MKYAVGLEYDGTLFYGWQSQSHARNVQDCVETAFSKVADESVAVICSGRTDAGVHALGQVVHFETDVSGSRTSGCVASTPIYPRMSRCGGSSWWMRIFTHVSVRVGAVTAI